MPDGYLYVTNFGAPPTYNGQTIYRINPEGGKELLLKSEQLHRPQGLVKIDDHTLAVSNSQNGKLFLLDTQNKELTLLAEAGMPLGNLTFGHNVIYGASNKGNQILKIDLKGQVGKLCCTEKEGDLVNPLGIDFDEKNNRLIISEAQRGNLKALDLNE